MTQQTEILAHYLARHKTLCGLIDEYTKPGKHAPGAVECYRKDLRGLEASIVETLKVLRGHGEKQIMPRPDSGEPKTG